MAELGNKARWARRLTGLALVLGVGGATAALVAAVGSGQGAWSFRAAFAVLRFAFYAAAAGGVIGLLAFVLSLRSGTRTAWPNLLSMVVAAGFCFYLADQVSTAGSVPAIHDVATNLDDLPQFAALTVRADNLEKIPDNDRPELAAMDPESRWKALHREGYPELRTVRVPWAPAETLRRAAAVARSRGWEIARVDSKGGTLEATATTFFFRFKDDVVVRVRPGPAGGSFVDMRSISRVGGSDVGVNADRVRAFLADLQQGGA